MNVYLSFTHSVAFHTTITVFCTYEGHESRGPDDHPCGKVGVLCPEKQSHPTGGLKKLRTIIKSTASTTATPAYAQKYFVLYPTPLNICHKQRHTYSNTYTTPPP